MSNLVTGNAAVSEIVETVKNLPVISREDMNFLQEHKKHLGAVLENTYIWRTDLQKRSIIADAYHPTAHSKFHQAILEQKVQFDQAMYLAKDFEIKKLEVEELECDISDLGISRREEIKKKKLQIEMQFKQYELKNMQIAMKYRMMEVKGWQEIIDTLLHQMRDGGLSEEVIWKKDTGELASMFLQSMTNLHGIMNSTDGAERNNLVALARFTYEQAKQANLLEKFVQMCNMEQKESVAMIAKLHP